MIPAYTSLDEWQLFKILIFRLKGLIPSLCRKEDVSQLDVVLEAIRYIDTLRDKLIDIIADSTVTSTITNTVNSNINSSTFNPSHINSTILSPPAHQELSHLPSPYSAHQGQRQLTPNDQLDIQQIGLNVCESTQNIPSTKNSSS